MNMKLKFRLKFFQGVTHSDFSPVEKLSYNKLIYCAYELGERRLISVQYQSLIDNLYLFQFHMQGIK